MEKVDLEKGKKKRRMGRSPCCNKEVTKKGAWSPEEDDVLIDYISKNGHGTWRHLPKLAGLSRCGKSCRLRWTNYLRPDIKRGNFSHDEEKTIIHLHSMLGNKWAVIASHLPGRTDNEIKNFWNSRIKKRAATEPSQQQLPQPLSTRHMVQWESARLEAEARLSIEPLPVSSSSEVKPECIDHFLGLWNSEVGESFRNASSSSSSSQSPMSQFSSSTKDESASGIIIHTHPSRMLICTNVPPVFNMGLKKEPANFFTGSDSTKYFAMDDSTRTNMNLQLDCSTCHDIEVLQESSDDDDDDEDVSIYLQDQI